MSSGPAPVCGQRPCGMALAAVAGAARGSVFCLFRGTGRHVSQAASLQSSRPRALRLSSGLLHLLPLAVLQPVQNDAVPGPLPRELQARPSRGRGGGWSQRRGRREGSDGNILRRVPPGARRATADCTTGGCAGRRPRRRTRQDVHRQGASGWDPCRAGVPPRAFCLGGRQSSPPPTAVWASLTQDPELCKLSGLLASPQRKANSN